MIEIVLAIALCVMMARIATADEQSGLVWGIVTFVLCLGSLSIPIPFLRILIAGVAAFVLMVVVKTITER